MPKLKTRKAVAKRFQVAKSGLVSRGQANRRHNNGLVPGKLVRHRRTSKSLPLAILKKVKQMLGHNAKKEQSDA